MMDEMDLSLEDMRAQFALLSEQHEAPEMIEAFDAILKAVKVVEDKPELMQELSVIAAPLMSMAPMMLSKMMMPGT